MVPIVQNRPASRRRAATWFVLAALVAVPSIADAQLGGLVRKAKEKVVRDAGDKSGVNATVEGEAVKFGAVTVELTPETLDKVMKGMQVGRNNVDAPNGRAALVTKRDKLANDAADIWNSHGNAITAHNDKLRKIDECRRDRFNALEKARNDSLSQKTMTDVAFRDKVMAITMRLAQGQAKGDSTAVSKAMSEMQALTGGSKADTVAVDRACGAALAPLAAETRMHALNDEARQVDQQIRDLETAAAAEEVKASGLQPQQYSMARERIEMYLSRAASNSKQNGFTSTELQALNARRAELQKLM